MVQSGLLSFADSAVAIDFCGLFFNLPIPLKILRLLQHILIHLILRNWRITELMKLHNDFHFQLRFDVVSIALVGELGGVVYNFFNFPGQL